MLEQYLQSIHDYFYSMIHDFNPVPTAFFLLLNLLKFFLLLLFLGHTIEIFRFGFKKEIVSDAGKDIGFFLVLVGLEYIIYQYYDFMLSIKPF